jgi:BASS family bile acid:Na+ symporter
MFERYPEYEYLLARIQLVCFMLGMGITLPLADFRRVWHKPRSLLYGLVFHLFVVPFLAVGINHLFDLTPGIAIGLILVALMPGGTLSKLFVHLGRGNVALAITLSAFSTLATVVTVPALLRLLAAEYVPENFTMPVDQIVQDVTVYLLVPLGVGMVIARQVPNHGKTLAYWCVRIGWVFVVVMVVGSLGSGRIRPGEYGLKVPAAIILFCLLAQQLSMLPYYLLHWPRPDRLSIGVEVTMRNMNLALLLFLLFPGGDGAESIAGGVLFVVLFYAAVAMFAGFPLALNHRRLSKREAKVDPVPQGH